MTSVSGSTDNGRPSKKEKSSSESAPSLVVLVLAAGGVAWRSDNGGTSDTEPLGVAAFSSRECSLHFRSSS